MGVGVLAPATEADRDRATTSARRRPADAVLADASMPPASSGSATVTGRISAPGGPYLYDSQGRIVFFHGVDAVYKYAAL